MTARSLDRFLTPIFMAFGAMLFVPSPAAADAAKGLQIMTAQDNDDAGWRTVRVSGTMTLIDAAGRSVSRAFDLARIERRGGGLGDVSRMTFNSPADVRGTVLLTHGKVEPADDDQWLYLPVERRVRRIASSNRTGKFLSSEFSFEDMGGSELQDNTYDWVRDEACPGQPSLTCHVVIVKPRNRRSGYSQRVTWLDVGEYRPFLTQFYNRRGQLEKQMVYSGYREYRGHWRPGRLDMQNVQTGKRTILDWSGYNFGASVSGSEMSPQGL